MTPVGDPSKLLERRPDIAAANGNIGVYGAALYPTLTLAGASGGETLGAASAAMAGYWAAALLPLLDGGRRHADAADQLDDRRYAEGAADHLEVVTAQIAELEARRAGLQIRTQRLVAAIDLVRALGGDWITAARKSAAGAASNPSARGAGL